VKCVQLGCFRRGSTSALKFYLDIVVHSWRQETRDTGLSGGEDRIPLRSLVLTILEYDGQADGRTDLFAIGLQRLQS